MSFRPVTCIVTALLVGPAVLLSAAPTAADPPSPPAPDPTAATGTTATPAAASATMTTTARRRGLRVQVARPAAARKRVKVRVVGPRLPNGKRFRATIRRTRTWKNARPGVYRIRAKTIRFRDQRIVPRISRKKVRIRADRARKRAVVRYAKPVFCQRGGTRLFAWGDNDFGQLGIARRADRLRPLANRWLRGVTAVTGGLRSTYALCRDGSVWAWGYNGNGELGINRGGNRLWPVRVAGLRNITAIAAADQSAYALRADGTVWAWGSGRYGELGDGTSGVGRLSAKPVKVQLPGPAGTIAAGGYSAYAALRGSGEVYAWGNGGVGQRGDGTTGESTPTPVRVTGLTGVAELAAGHATVYARTASNEAYGWGNNNEGEIRLGPSGPGASSSTPFFLGSGASVIGASHSA